MYNFDIEQIDNEEDWGRANSIRNAVFQGEMGILVPDYGHYGHNPRTAIHLIAKLRDSGKAVAVLSVINTTGSEDLPRRYGIDFPPLATSARYTSLAVLRAYRGLNVPLMMMLCGHRTYIAPMSIDYSWLLFHPKFAASSSMCRLLGFTIAKHGVPSEYGEMCALVRDERQARSGIPAANAEQISGQAFARLTTHTTMAERGLVGQAG